MKQVTPDELDNWMAENRDFRLIDVRQSWERDLFNIGGQHIPFDDLTGSMHDLPKDKDIVLYCERGIRSLLAIQRLERLGFRNLFNLAGGTKAWKEYLASPKAKLP